MQEYLNNCSIRELAIGFTSIFGVFYDLTKIENVTREEVEDAARKVLIDKIRALNEEIDTRFVDVRYRLNHLHELIGTKDFIDEYQKISDAITDYKINIERRGFRRARRYAIRNRIIELLEESKYHSRAVGYVLNNVEKRDDTQLLDTLHKVIEMVNLEFGL